MGRYRNITIKVTSEILKRVDAMKGLLKNNQVLAAVMGMVSRSAMFRMAVTHGLEILEGKWLRIDPDLKPALEELTEVMRKSDIDITVQDVAVVALRTGLESISEENPIPEK